MSTTKFSVVDQIPVHNGKTQAQALHDAVKLAQICDQLGYYRYWFAEHHATPCYACAAPELMMNRVAATTQNIRLGSGGVMLSHYSPYKIAEQFKTLSALYPDRIDLGIGRAPGGAQLPSRALAFPHAYGQSDDFIPRVAMLSELLNEDVVSSGALQGLSTTPTGAVKPQPWMLGSSDGSIELAARFGWHFVLALFIGNHERPATIIQRYRELYRHYHAGETGNAMIAVASIAAENKEEAEYLAATHTFWKLQAQVRGIREGLRPPKECLDLYKSLSPSEKDFFDTTRANMITGNTAQCRQRIQDLADYYDVDEVIIVAVTYDFSAREKSYRALIAA